MSLSVRVAWAVAFVLALFTRTVQAEACCPIGAQGAELAAQAEAEWVQRVGSGCKLGSGWSNSTCDGRYWGKLGRSCYQARTTRIPSRPMGMPWNFATVIHGPAYDIACCHAQAAINRSADWLKKSFRWDSARSTRRTTRISSPFAMNLNFASWWLWLTSETVSDRRLARHRPVGPRAETIALPHLRGQVSPGFDALASSSQRCANMSDHRRKSV